MKSSLFCTNSVVKLGTGGGLVCIEILKAMQEVMDVKQVLSGENISPTFYGLPDNPFLYDYLASSKVEKVDIAQFYGAPFGLTVERLRPAKIIVDVAPHVIELSREEHMKMGIDFDANYPHLSNPYLYGLYMRHVKIADVVVVHSESSKLYLTAKLGLRSDVRVIPHGCYLPEKVEELPDKFDVAYLGQFGVDKGLIYLIQAWSQLNLPESTLILAGGNKETGMNLLRLANARGKYHLTGYVQNPREIYAKCSVYIQPSVTEGFSLTTLEALASGRPVIVTEGAGISELVEDGKDGFVVPIRDSNAIADRIQWFRDNPERLRIMGGNARKKAEQFTWEKIRRKYQELYAD